MNQYDSVEFRSVKAKIRAICKQRRIRLEEFMKTFDVHRVKKIKTDQFKRAIDMSGVQLSSKEVNVIIAKYCLPNDRLFVDYRRFCDLIDKVFTIKRLEARPEMQKTKSIDIVEPKYGLDPITQTEAHVLDRIKKNLEAAARPRGIILKDVFRDLDHNNSGYVTRAEFSRGILGIVRLNESDLNVLKKAYGNQLDVNYRALHYDISRSPSDINASIARPQFPERRRQRVHCENLEIEGVCDLESQLHQLAARDRIRVRSFFTDFDSFRTGKITRPQFERCVKLCFTTISEQQLNLLANKYANSSMENAVIDYAAFAACVEGGEDALSKLTTASKGSQCSRDIRGVLDERETKIFDAMMKRLGTYCCTRRMNLKPAFQDFDRTRREVITTPQFFRVMDMLQLVISEQERAVILLRYKSALDDSYINYVTFCLDLAQLGTLEAPNQRPNSANSHIISEILSPLRLSELSTKEAEGKVAARTAPILLHYMQQYVKQYRVRIEENFRDFDKLRHGKLTFAKFCAGLNACGFIVSPEEVDILANLYACNETDAQGRKLVKWKLFVDDVDSVFTVKGLERTPLFNTNRQLSNISNSETQDLDIDEEALVTTTIRNIHSMIKRNRLEIKDALEDFDTAKHGYISTSKFERVLSVHNLLPNAKLCRLIIRKFREKSPNPLETLVQFDYRAFLHALELMETETLEPLILPDSISNRNRVSGSGHKAIASPRRMRLEEREESIDLERVVAKLRRQIIAKRIRLKEFITEGDKLRTGEITIPKFHTALNRCGCTLNATDIRTLTMQFQSSCHKDKIDWRAFLDALEHTSLSESDQNGDNQHLAPMIEQILDRLRLKVQQERLQLKPYLQDYDPMRGHRVTKSQFTAVLDRMKVGLQPSEAESLAGHFCVPTSQSQSKNPDIDYLAFLRCVGEVE